MRIFITGASGFIGSYIIPVLVGSNHEVIAFDIAQFPKILKKYKKNITYIQGNLEKKEDIYKAIIKSKPTHILHLGSILAEPCEKNPIKGFSINFNSTLHLLDMSRKINLQRFVMTSSISVFGRGLEEPVGDHAKKQPETIYGQTKLACEYLLQWYKEKKYISTGAVRFPWVFGAGRETGITALWSSKLLDDIAAGKKVTVDNPDEVGNWLYVKDAVKALILMLSLQDHTLPVYNIMGSEHSIREVLEKVKTIEPQANIEYTQEGKKYSPYPSSYYDTNARKELGWIPDYTIEEAIKDQIRLNREKGEGSPRS